MSSICHDEVRRPGPSNIANEGHLNRETRLCTFASELSFDREAARPNNLVNTNRDRHFELSWPRTLTGEQQRAGIWEFPTLASHGNPGGELRRS